MKVQIAIVAAVAVAVSLILVQTPTSAKAAIKQTQHAQAAHRIQMHISIAREGATIQE
jgi:hypothetical protein